MLANDAGTGIFTADVNLADFVAEASFTGNASGFGVFLRWQEDVNSNHSVVVFEFLGEWNHWMRLESVDEVLAEGAVTGVEFGENRRRHVRVAAHGERGLLFVNGEFQAELDLSRHTAPGSVGVFALDFDDPVSVRFEDFTISPLDADAFEAMKPAGLPTPAPTATPIPTPTAAPSPASSAVFGPVDGSLTDDDGVAIFNSGVNLSDFVAEVTFIGDLPQVWMPIRVDDGLENWHFVILEKRSGSSFAWTHRRRQNGEDSGRVQAGIVSSEVATGANARNHVRVIAYGDVGLLFINGAFEAELDFGGVTGVGAVDLAAFGEIDAQTSERNPVSVRFEGFSVRPLSAAYGPEGGAIEHKDDGLINGIKSRIAMSDGVIEATFSNPYPTREGSWSVGFLFRNPKANQFHVVVIRSDGKWHHRLRTGDSDSTQRIADEYSERVSTRADGSNQVRVIAMGEDGWLFINGAFISNLDLSGGAKFGGVTLVGRYFTSDGIPGRYARFADFTIHSIER